MSLHGGFWCGASGVDGCWLLLSCGFADTLCAECGANAVIEIAWELLRPRAACAAIKHIIMDLDGGFWCCSSGFAGGLLVLLAARISSIKAKASVLEHAN